jgi:hypothetical protein
MRARTSASQACGSTPFILHETIKLYIAAARLPPRSDPQKSHDFLLCMYFHNRKAWLFAGSERGGERAAMMYSFVETCKLNQVDPRAWLADVLARIVDHHIKDLAALLPWNWAAARGLAARILFNVGHGEERAPCMRLILSSR